MQIVEKETSGEKNQTLFVWFLLAFVIGLGLRLWRLGEMSFTLAEAQIAQGAWQMAMGNAAGVQGNAAYAGLSAVLFHLFEPSFFYARLTPVLFGSSLILVPWFWRNRLGERVALVLAFGLAIDPTLLSFSRQIVTPIFALAGLAWAVTALKVKRPMLAGSLFALAFLGGYSFWVIVVVGISVLLIWQKRGKLEFVETPFRNKVFLLQFLTSFLISLVVISSAFLLCTGGLGGIGAGVVELVGLFSHTYKMPVYQPIMVAIAYSILPLFFAIWALVDDLRNHKPLKNLPFIFGWGVSVLLSALLGRQDLGMLVFAAVFAWLGAAERIAEIVEQAPGRREIVLGVGAFQIVIFIYMQMVGGRLSGLPINSQEFRLSLFALLAGLLLLVISTILVRMGWSGEVGRQALQNSLLVTLLVVTVGIGLRSVRSQQETTSLSLLAGPIVLTNKDVELVVGEIDQIGRADVTEITYELGKLEQEFAWFFRNQVSWENAQSVLQADLMLTQSETDFSAADAYRGRNVVLFRQIDKQVVKPVDFLKTLLGEPLPMISNNGVLWVRLNLFTGAN